MAGRKSLWDNELVCTVAFHPRRCASNTTNNDGCGGWIDDVVVVGDGTKIAHRLYVARPSEVKDEAPVLVYFHANAELCTDMETEISLFYKCGFQAVLCPEFRGYGWGTGKPRLTCMCPDAEAVFEAAPKILAAAGLKDTTSIPLIVSGRSLGAACAVHVAAHFGPERVAALLVESGCYDLLKLPMVQRFRATMPEMLEALAQSPEPLRTMDKMGKVTVPTLIIHGNQDDMIPVEQAVAAHKACGSCIKKLVRLKQCSHNDVRAVSGTEYRNELSLLVNIANHSEPPEALCRLPPPSTGVFGMIARGLRCLPGMRRCLSNEGGSESAATPQAPVEPVEFPGMPPFR